MTDGPHHSIGEVLSLLKEEHEDVTVAGRIMQKRIMGKASFSELQDSSGRIQLYISRDEICPGEDKTLYNDVFKKYPLKVSNRLKVSVRSNAGSKSSPRLTKKIAANVSRNGSMSASI